MIGAGKGGGRKDGIGLGWITITGLGLSRGAVLLLYLECNAVTPIGTLLRLHNSNESRSGQVTDVLDVCNRERCYV